MSFLDFYLLCLFFLTLLFQNLNSKSFFFFNFPLLYQIFNWFSTPFCFFLFLRILILNSEQKHTRDRFLPTHIYIHFYSYSQGHYQRFDVQLTPFFFNVFIFSYSLQWTCNTYPRPFFTHTFTSIICLAVGSTFL